MKGGGAGLLSGESRSDTLTRAPWTPLFTRVGTAGDEGGSPRLEDPTALGLEFPTRVGKSGSSSELGHSDTSRRKATTELRAQQPPASARGILSRSPVQPPIGS